MASAAWGLLKTVVPRIPLMLSTALLNLLGLSPAASRQELKIEVITAFIRSCVDDIQPLKKVQDGSIADPGITGTKWISKVALPAPEAKSTEDKLPSAREALVGAISQLGDGSDTYKLPEVQEVTAEWTGYRTGVDKKAPRPDLSEAEHYRKLMEDPTRTTNLTILYFHGGAYMAMDPATHRPSLARLCQLSHGRALSVRYRLAPQNPFPAGLLDAFVSYLSLLSPLPGSFHEPVSASSIVFSGDSAGAGLATALLLMLLTLRRMSITRVLFHGKEVEIPLPGGTALTSPWVDISRSMPSVYRNARYDYISPPTKAPSIAPGPFKAPPDEIWPSSPPRVDTYCDASVILNPLVTPLAAKEELWEGHPPVWISVGSEGLEDEGLILGRRLTATGAAVVEDFQGMPHVFAYIFPKTEFAIQCNNSMAAFCSAVDKGERIESSARFWTKEHGVTTMTLEEVAEEMVGDDAEVDRLLLAGKQWRIDAERKMVEEWKAGGDAKKIRANL